MKHDHTMCPLCRTPLVVLSPDPYYLLLHFFTLASKAAEPSERTRYDRLIQYRLLHDGDRNPALRGLNGGVSEDFMVQVQGRVGLVALVPGSLGSRRPSALCSGELPHESGALEKGGCIEIPCTHSARFSAGDLCRISERGFSFWAVFATLPDN
eukprot:CAMPEP_0117523850 /NCGR_PEP_ID=MMETSP0784-20121206/34939_1 /TAXON_ID=39447 /ORGANISM="" /LENGTH=153 /DNA_ID=CAMNT_0005319973 /DNA_START=244 /DNA_END=706 /DNA_ORIENTATION=-